MTKRGFFGFAAALAAGGSLLIALASCTMSERQTGGGKVSLAGPKPASQTPTSYSQCVPYARDYSGIQIYGDAWTWWSKADGRYDRGTTPKRGAVLTLKKTSRLNAGHVAVVAAIVDSRRILVDHANWGDNPTTRGKIHMRQPVIDVSPQNDWSAVRVMNTLGSFGAVYPAYGFIYADNGIRTAQNERPAKPSN